MSQVLQLKHAVAPCALEYVPTPQPEQEAEPIVLEYEPGQHAVQAPSTALPMPLE